MYIFPTSFILVFFLSIIIHNLERQQMPEVVKVKKMPKVTARTPKTSLPSEAKEVVKLLKDMGFKTEDAKKYVIEALKDGTDNLLERSLQKVKV
jgi:Holliday junction resolvasome RuvABC DNA-binding subunit